MVDYVHFLTSPRNKANKLFMSTRAPCSKIVLSRVFTIREHTDLSSRLLVNLNDRMRRIYEILSYFITEFAAIKLLLYAFVACILLLYVFPLYPIICNRNSMHFQILMKISKNDALINDIS